MKIPILNTILIILSLYASEGTPSSIAAGTKWQNYLSRLAPRILIALTISWISVRYSHNIKAEDVDGYVISGYPSLIGFGIGVYALIFGMSRVFFTYLESIGIASPVAYINGNMAFSLLILILCLLIAFISRLTGSPSLLFSTFIFLYGITAIIDLVLIIFIAALQDTIKNKSKE
ncbi:hypothetical protein [Aquitalea sp. ASV11]|uniref:hypothetical protein n=1 Tax=Aquitalea sp. ASV11 TaxID=2795103 RepID=UPI0018ECA606|nr:hypothetical protein [Aquitalea sp. ASV11]